MRAGDRGHPLAHRFVHRVLQRRAPGSHGHDFGTQQPHPPHVEGLALDVDRAHVHGAVEAEQRGRGRGGDTVLPGTRLRDDALLAHALRQQGLAEHVVDLVRAGVREVFAFQKDPDAEPVREPLAHGDRGRPARVRTEQRRELGPERIVVPDSPELRLEVVERVDQRLGREPAAEVAEATQADGFGTGTIELHRCSTRGNGHQAPNLGNGGGGLAERDSIIRAASPGPDSKTIPADAAEAFPPQAPRPEPREPGQRADTGRPSRRRPLGRSGGSHVNVRTQRRPSRRRPLGRSGGSHVNRRVASPRAGSRRPGSRHTSRRRRGHKTGDRRPRRRRPVPLR